MLEWVGGSVQHSMSSKVLIPKDGLGIPETPQTCQTVQIFAQAQDEQMIMSILRSRTSRISFQEKGPNSVNLDHWYTHWAKGLLFLTTLEQ